MKRIFAAILLFGFASLGANPTYAQCGSCIDNYLSVYDEFKGSKAVFVGKVVEVKKVEDSKNTDTTTNTDYYEFRVRFAVKTLWKNDLPKDAVITNIGSTGSDFKIGESYLVFAYVRHYDPDKLRANIGCCSRTKLVSKAAEDLKIFKNNGEKPVNVVRRPAPGNGPSMSSCPSQNTGARAE